MRTAGGFGSLVYPLAVRSHLHFRRGRWSAAYADAGESVRLADDLGVLSLLAHALGALAEVEAATGREADCRAHAARALAITSEHQADAVALYSRHALPLLELGLGNPAAAIDQLSVAESIATRLEQEEPALVPWRANYVEALVLTGRPEEAERELAVLERQAETTGRVAARAAALRCRGLLATEDDYEARFAAALELHRETPIAFEEGRTQLALGGRRRRARRRGDARAPLRAALEIFERLGARPWADTARAEIRATGETVERREGTGIEELSPHELQVARLVAEGRTNRECAAALFLSPKTIEYHLGQIYRKLDVRGRAQLARLMAMELPEGEWDPAVLAEALS
jgi:DNA-binding CsgD family transcriptional regulator